MDAGCEQRHKLIDQLKLVVLGNGVKGLADEVKELNCWRRDIDALVNQIKGLKILILIASFLSAAQILVKVIKP